MKRNRRGLRVEQHVVLSGSTDMDRGVFVFEGVFSQAYFTSDNLAKALTIWK